LHSLNAFGIGLFPFTRAYSCSAEIEPEDRSRRDAASLSRESGSPEDREAGKRGPEGDRTGTERKREAESAGRGGGTQDERRSDRKGIVRGGQRKILGEEDNISLD